MRRRTDIAFPRTNSKTVVFTGGVNEGITNLELGPGDLFQCYNYEEIDGAFHGYSSVEGYERYDGQDAPSSVSVQFLEDEGDDAFAEVLLESMASTDTTDKSNYGRSTVQNNLVYTDSRLAFGEGSWWFNELVDCSWVCDLSDEPIDFSNDSYTLDGMVQVEAIFTSTAQLCDISGVINAKIEDGVLNVYITTDSGVENFASTGLINAGRWAFVSIVVVPNATTADVYIGINGATVDKFTTTGAALHVASDLVVGSGTNSDTDLYIDTFRLSKGARWKSVDAFAYSKVYPFSDFRYFIFNADDADRETQRLAITALDGSGPVRDVHILNGTALAVRDNAGATAGGLFVESAAGWVEITNTGSFISKYDTGSIPDDTLSPRTGEAFTAAPSGATGTLYDIVLYTGDPSSSLGEGSVVLDVSTGTLASGDVVTLTNYPTESITLTELPAVMTLGAGSDVFFKNARFAYFPPDDPNAEVAYFICNSPKIYYTDGTTVYQFYGPLDVTSNIVKIAFFSDRLWIAYADGHVFYSAPGDPANWSAEFGAGEIFLGDEVTNMRTAPGNALVITMKDSVKIIKASQPSDGTIDYPFYTEDFSVSQGAYTNSITSLLGDLYFCDDRGPTSMTQADAFGDFALGDLKKKAHITYQNYKTDFLGAYVQRKKSQYRVHFLDTITETTKMIFYTFSEKKVKGVTLVEYPIMMSCFHEGEDSDGNVFILAGDGEDNGFVYRIDSGTSFDGGLINASLKTAYYHYGTPRKWKRFYRVLLEISSANKMIFNIRSDYNYSSSTLMSSIQKQLQTQGQGGIWGSSIWGDFIWGGAIISNPMVYLNGYGTNMSIEVSTSSKHHSPHVLHNMVVDYFNGSMYM